MGSIPLNLSPSQQAWWWPLSGWHTGGTLQEDGPPAAQWVLGVRVRHLVEPCPLTCVQNLFPWLSRHGDQHPEVHLPRRVPDSLCRPVCGSLWTPALSAYPCHWLLVTCTLHVCQRAASCFPGDGKRAPAREIPAMSLLSEGLATSFAAWSEAQPWGECPFESVLPLILSLSPRVQHRGSLYLTSEFNYSLY